VYRLIDKNDNVKYLREGMLANLDVNQIETIEVQKGIDLTIEGEQLRNQNVITIRSSESLGEKNMSFHVRADSEDMSITGDPLIVVFHKGESKKMVGNSSETFKKLNPNDIKSINVFKGESAKTKYGKEGKNGVVEIYLKQSSDYKIK
ncbi:MAG: hypothetical protein AAFO69_08310, partial [Bacteroidota bacterium]